MQKFNQVYSFFKLSIAIYQFCNILPITVILPDHRFVPYDFAILQE
jgi:hypothetical protein